MTDVLEDPCHSCVVNVCSHGSCSDVSLFFIVLFFCLSEGGGSDGLLFLCGFEDDDLCDMKQGTDDEFDWASRSGSTPSESTGPSAAMKGSKYIYTEASRTKNGDQAM